MAVHRRRGPGGATAGRRGPLPAGDRRRPRRLHRASGGPGSRTTSRGSTSRRCPRTSPRCGGCWPTCSPRTRSGSGSRPGRTDEVVGLRLGQRPRGPVVPRDAVRPARDAGPRHRSGADGPRAGRDGGAARRPGGPRAGRRARLGDPHLGHVHRRRPADLERPVRPARDGAADPDLAAVRGGAPLAGRAAAAAPASSPSRSSRSPRPSPTASGASRRSSTTSTGR